MESCSSASIASGVSMVGESSWSDILLAESDSVEISAESASSSDASWESDCYTKLLYDSFCTIPEHKESDFEEQHSKRDEHYKEDTKEFVEACAEPLYDCAEISIATCSSFSLHYAMTSPRKVLKNCCLLAALLPAAAKLPSSVHVLKQFFVKLFPEAQPQLNLFCSCYHKLLTNQSQCDRCECTGSSVETFTTQLRRKLAGICMHFAMLILLWSRAGSRKGGRE